MGHCIIHEWQSRGEVSVCMTCGAELDRPAALAPVSAKQRRRDAVKRRRCQRIARLNHPTEVIIYRPRPKTG